MTRPHQNVAAARGMIRLGISWLDREAFDLDAGVGPFAVRTPYDPTVFAETYDETMLATGIIPRRAALRFDQLAADYRARWAS